MDQISYLKNVLPQIISQKKANKYWHSYCLTRMKRFFLQTLMIFVFQYSTVINLTFSYPALPMDPAIGIAFIVFYLFGNNAFWGLLLGGGCAYFLKGLPIPFVFFNLTADIGCGWMGAVLCQAVFSSDMIRSANFKEWIKFIKIIFFICFISSLIRIIPFLLNYKNMTHPIAVFYHFLNMWLADINGVLVLFTFVISWLALFYSRGNITNNTLKKLPIIATIVFIIFSVWFMKQSELIYVIVFAMLFSLFFSYRYGSYIATALLYIVSFIYLTYFMAHQQQYFLFAGVKWYMLRPIILLIFSTCMLYAAHLGDKKFLNKVNSISA